LKFVGSWYRSNAFLKQKKEPISQVMEDAYPVMAEEIQKWRDETPGSDQRCHLNNAGAALMPRPVIDAIKDHLDLETRIGGYEAGDAVSSKIDKAYHAVAELVGTRSANIAMVGNATVAISQALSAFDFEQGDTIITTSVDYSSNQIMLLNLAKRFGVEVIRAGDLPEGGADPESVRRLINQYRPKLMLMSWIPTHSGLVQDAKSIGEICYSKEVPLLLDGCQAVGQIEIDLSELKCDFLAATSRKFLRGPRGIGFLYVSDRMIQEGRSPLYPDTHGAEWTEPNNFRLSDSAKRFENWEFPVALQLGMGKAAEYSQSIGMEKISHRSSYLADYARKIFSEIDGVQIIDSGSKMCAIVSAALHDVEAVNAVQALRNQGINTSSASRSTSVIDMDAKQINSIVRISPHYYNTTEEIDACGDALNEFMNSQ